MKTLVLTRGAYRVDDDVAERVASAIMDDRRVVEISADVLGDGLRFDLLKLVCRHVVAIIDDPDDCAAEPFPEFSNVVHAPFGGRG